MTYDDCIMNALDAIEQADETLNKVGDYGRYRTVLLTLAREALEQAK